MKLMSMLYRLVMKGRIAVPPAPTFGEGAMVSKVIRTRPLIAFMEKINMRFAIVKWASALVLSCMVTTVLAQGAQSAPAEVPWNDRPWQERAFNSTYEDNSSFRHKQTFFFDPFIWAFSQEFADKFRMPKEWVDPGLKGAMAVAWRMTTIGQATCGLGGRAENCWQPLTCQMDIFFDSKTPLPWRYTDVVRDNFMRGISSTDYLPNLSAKSRKSVYLDRLGSKGPPLLKGPLTYHKGGFNGGSFFVAYFDREYEPGITLIGFTDACPMRVDSAAELRFFTEEEQRRTRGVITQFAHVVEFSQPYIKKITEAYASQNKPNEDVMKRVMDDYFKRHKSDPNFAPRQ